ncbi:hypothetical protein OF83DRAFT_1154167 [Amylostereum chailletii]|nr:hypothetical protein OF83DRAFT_1154167 [Amylostereum chailletii]
MASFTLFTLTLALLFANLFSASVSAYPSASQPSLQVLSKRDDPTFPDDPASCPICEQSYSNINSCIAAAPVLANFTQILFNPGAFIDIIKCACGDTFQSAYPQCVDCFQRTNQTQFLNTTDVPSVISGIRQICGSASAILGNVTGADNETFPTSSPSVSASMALRTTSDIPFELVGLIVGGVLFGVALVL